MKSKRWLFPCVGIVSLLSGILGCSADQAKPNETSNSYPTTQATTNIPSTTAPNPTTNQPQITTVAPTTSAPLVRAPYTSRPFVLNAGQASRYITPDDPKVKETASSIVAFGYSFYSDFNKFRDWVSDNVTYMADDKAWGVSEYFQTPAETLSLKHGDCEDFAILMVSLLRAYGVPADQVYVAVGFSNDGANGHAYIVEKWYTGTWRYIEPQAGPIWNMVFKTDESLSEDYRNVACFNDLNSIVGPPMLPPGAYEFISGYSAYPVTEGAKNTYYGRITANQLVSVAIEWFVDRSWAGTVYPFNLGWIINVYDPSGRQLYNWSGKELSRSFSFTASASGTYVIEVLKLDSLPRGCRLTLDPKVWNSQPPEGTLIPTIPTASQSGLSLASYSFNPTSVAFGRSTTLSFALNGGQSGNYTLKFIKDVGFGSDETTGTIEFYYNGTSATVSFVFIPPSAGSYHFDLEINGKKVFSQPNDVTRLKVT